MCHTVMRQQATEMPVAESLGDRQLRLCSPSWWNQSHKISNYGPVKQQAAESECMKQEQWRVAAL